MVLLKLWDMFVRAKMANLELQGRKALGCCLWSRWEFRITIPRGMWSLALLSFTWEHRLNQNLTVLCPYPESLIEVELKSNGLIFFQWRNVPERTAFMLCPGYCSQLSPRSTVIALIGTGRCENCIIEDGT